MAKKRNLTEEQVSQLLHKSENENKERNSILGSNDDDEIDHISKISDCKSSDNLIGEFPQTKKIDN